MASPPQAEVWTVAGREVAITNPTRCCFRAPGTPSSTWRSYYLRVAEGALRGSGGRPNVLVRYPNGIGEEFFYQKRAPAIAARRGSRW